MTIPDYVSPIVAWRVWQLDQTGLRSLNGEPWLPGKSLAAGCRLFGAGAAAGTHEVPAKGRTCGVYAAKSLVHLRRAGYDRHGVHGEVCLWGSVVENEMGWRAEYAYPKSLVLPLDLLPRGMGRCETWLKRLAAYDCEISIAAKERMVPLWARCSGYNATGIDLVIQQCQSWYTGRREERRIKPGDRVAVLGCGIAVVGRVDGECIYAQMLNRSMLRIGRKHVLWNAGNMRWEVIRTSGFRNELD